MDRCGDQAWTASRARASGQVVQPLTKVLFPRDSAASHAAASPQSVMKKPIAKRWPSYCGHRQLSREVRARAKLHKQNARIQTQPVNPAQSVSHVQPAAGSLPVPLFLTWSGVVASVSVSPANLPTKLLTLGAWYTPCRAGPGLRAAPRRKWWTVCTATPTACSPPPAHGHRDLGLGRGRSL